MAISFSWGRSLAAAARLQFAGLKRDAKRLQRATPEAFGQAFSLAQCQEAVARMRGATSWHEAVRQASSSGVGADDPPWYVRNRTEVHLAVVDALATAQVETRESGGCRFAGPLASSVLPALVLWIEEMTARREAGLVAIDTAAPAVQDTALWPAAVAAGLQAALDSCRTIDTRAKNLPVAISCSPRDWVANLVAALDGTDQKCLENAGVVHTFESLAAATATAKGEDDDEDRDAPYQPVFFSPIDRTVSYLVHGGPEIPPQLQGCSDEPRLQHTIDRYLAPARAEPASRDALRRLSELTRLVQARQFHLGTILASESQRRPAVVLFDSRDAVSTVLAGAVHALYYWRYVGWRKRHSGIEVRPVLYINDLQGGTLAPWLPRSFCSRTIIADGTPGATIPSHLEGSLFDVQCSASAITFAGKRVDIDFQVAA